MPDNSPTMPVRQFRPDIEISITGRDSPDWQDMLPSFVSCSTRRMVNQPAGMWEVVLNSARDSKGRTWGQRIRPMDYVEIRFARYGKVQNTGAAFAGHEGTSESRLPVVMRGFVDDIREEIGVDQQGEPIRQVHVTGRDLGKLLLTKHIYILRFLGSAGTALAALGPDSIMAIFGGNISEPNLTPQEFLDRVKKVFFDGETDASGTPLAGRVGVGPTNLVANVPPIKFTADASLDDLTVAFVSIAQLEGPVWNLLTHYQGRPLCELLFRDTQDGPEVLWRWTPYKNRDGDFIDPGKDPGNASTVSTAAIIHQDLGTSDHEVLNYFFVYPTISQGFMDDFHSLLATQDDGGESEGQNGQQNEGATGRNPVFRQDLADRYGFRPLEVPFPLMRGKRNPTNTDVQKLIEEWAPVGRQGANWLDHALAHSAELETGSLLVRGDERIQHGTYLTIKETGQEFYVTTVAHTFQVWPSPVFQTQLNVERGRWTKGSPYPAETSLDSPGIATGGGTDGGEMPNPTELPPEDSDNGDGSGPPPTAI